jgi:hypothetical protein
MVNRYFNPTVFRGEFYSPPVGLLEDVLKQAQVKYDQNYEASEKLRGLQIQALEADKPRADALIAERNNKIDDIVTRYGGDYSLATKDLNSLLSQIRTEHRPGGEIATMEENYGRYNDFLERERKRVAEGKIVAEDLNAYNDMLLNSYTGVGTPSKTGLYNRLDPQSLAEYTDGSKLVTEAIGKVKPRKQAITKSKLDKSGNWFNVSEEVEWVDPEEMNNAITNALTSDDKWMAYNMQKAQLNGVSPEEYLTMQVDQYQKTYTPIYSGEFSRGEKEEYKGFDEATKFRLQKAHEKDMLARREASAKRIAKFKKDLDKEEEENQFGDRPFELVGNNINNTFQFKPVKPQPGEVGGAFGNTSSFLGNAFNFGGRDVNIYPNVNGILSGSEPRKDVNMALLQQIKNSKPSWGADEEIWKAYNSALQMQENFASQIYMDPYVQVEQQREAADQLIPRFMNSPVHMWEVDGNGQMVEIISQADKAEKLKGMYDFDKRTAKVPVVGTSRSFSGDAPAGHVVKDGGKTYIIAENNAVMNRYNISNNNYKSVKERAFGFVKKGLTQSEEPFEMIGPDGRNVPTMGVTEIINGEPVLRYYPAIADRLSGRLIPDKTDPWTKVDLDGRVVPMNAADIEKAVLGNQFNFMRQKQKLSPKKEYNQAFDNYEIEY